MWKQQQQLEHAKNVQPDKCKIHWDKQTVPIAVLVLIKIKKPKHFVCHVYLDKNNPQQDKHPATIVPLIRSVKAHPRPNAMLVLREERAKKDLPRVVIVVPELC
jgi:hypothetical protein